MERKIMGFVIERLDNDETMSKLICQASQRENIIALW